MISKKKSRPYIIRLLIVGLFCVAFVFGFNEIVFLFQKDEYDRAPTTVQIVIPPGTSLQIDETGYSPISSDDLIFVVGDVLEVVNQDNIAHQLGPIWVPRGASSKLILEEANNYFYTCSFETDQYLGFEVRQPTTLGTRMTAISLAAPTMTALVFLYSLLIFPVQPKKISTEVEK
ncbi:MAG TPA: hypothetical protein VLM80_11015 [Anaerolineales bacterium]|nr:hypothetical protein [Anaerolineales bacterium]